MGLQQQLAIRSKVLKGHVNQYAILGLIIAILSILLASCLVSYQLTGAVTLQGIFLAQTTNPAIWALNITPFMFAYWGQSFCLSLASKAESIIEDKEREYAVKSDDLESKLKYESNHDGLTNLPNARLLTTRLNQAIEGVRDEKECTVLIMISINHFRDIILNTGGYTANNLLVQFSERLKSILMEPYLLQSNMGMNMVARVQSVEFAILIPRLNQEHKLETIIKKILNESSSNYMIDGHPIEVKTTLGIAVHPPHGNNAKQMIEQASLALISAQKEHLRSRIFEESMTKHLKTRRVLINELAKAVEQNNYELLFQPIVNISTGQTVGFDTKVRFTDGKYQDMSIERLISTADGTNILKHLTKSTLEYAGDILEKLYKENQSVYIQVFIFELEDLELPITIKKILTERNIPAKCLKLEITEHACLKNQSKTIKILTELQKLGLDIAVSDFGSGYSSFIYLTNFPIKALKINKNFVKLMLTDEKKNLIVKALVQLADALKLLTTAEGIDDEETVSALKKLGCVQAQGDFFAKPMVEKDMFATLAKIKQA
tara:strand:- start:351 stop:1994 length:1644 start_codon:yes stop_codon:yes gene_type:complete